MIPAACVGVPYKFRPGPLIFSRALAQFRGWAAWLNWQEFPICRTLTTAPPGPEAVSKPTCSLRMNPGSALPGYSPVYAHVAFLVLRGPFPTGRPCPLHCPGPTDPWPTLAD